MASDSSDDGDPTLPGPRSESSAAFAATIAPESSPAVAISPVAATQTPIPPSRWPDGTTSGAVTRPRSWVERESDVTLGAPAGGEPALLPLVSAAHYRADREIARGGMGRIVAAQDQRLGRAVALKELLTPAP